MRVSLNLIGKRILFVPMFIISLFLTFLFFALLFVVTLIIGIPSWICTGSCFGWVDILPDAWFTDKLPFEKSLDFLKKVELEQRKINREGK